MGTRPWFHALVALQNTIRPSHSRNREHALVTLQKNLSVVKHTQLYNTHPFTHRPFKNTSNLRQQKAPSPAEVPLQTPTPQTHNIQAEQIFSINQLSPHAPSPRARWQPKWIKDKALCIWRASFSVFQLPGGNRVALHGGKRNSGVEPRQPMTMHACCSRMLAGKGNRRFEMERGIKPSWSALLRCEIFERMVFVPR